MFYIKLLLLLAFVFGVTPALAGEATYADMRGRWQSTQCTPPYTLPPSDHNSEAAANDLNAQVLAHNQFVAEAKSYMDCLAAESNKDAKALNYLVIESAKMLIDATQEKIKESSFYIQKKQEK